MHSLKSGMKFNYLQYSPGPISHERAWQLVWDTMRGLSNQSTTRESYYDLRAFGDKPTWQYRHTSGLDQSPGLPDGSRWQSPTSRDGCGTFLHNCSLTSDLNFPLSDALAGRQLLLHSDWMSAEKLATKQIQQDDLGVPSLARQEEVSQESSIDKITGRKALNTLINSLYNN